MDSTAQSLFITGPDPNLKIPLYKKVANYDHYNTSQDSIKLGLDGNLSEIKKYDYGYLYGPFTRVFLPKQDNDEISKKCTEILELLTLQKANFDCFICMLQDQIQLILIPCFL